jgi:hypothetical protein
VPVIAFFVTRSACRSLARDNVRPFQGSVGSRVRRTPSGGYEVVDGEPVEVGAIRADLVDEAYRRPPAGS